ncbi:hypothetical protein Syun_030104 [Stephania yunnanensis]|uniref:Uncharacterized protein n=1 Tax=Stephania yunnanensis TaxID=152371 RepID=A0AAP0E987_9MAGN
MPLLLTSLLLHNLLHHHISPTLVYIYILENIMKPSWGHMKMKMKMKIVEAERSELEIYTSKTVSLDDRG